MIQNESMVKIIDNSWAITAKVIRVLVWSATKFAKIWDKVVLAVKTARPWEQVKSWDVVKWLLVRSVKWIGRKDGTHIRFQDNGVVLIEDNGTPLWKRVFWPVAREIRDRWYQSIAKMADEVV